MSKPPLLQLSHLVCLLVGNPNQQRGVGRRRVEVGSHHGRVVGGIQHELAGIVEPESEVGEGFILQPDISPLRTTFHQQHPRQFVAVEFEGV